MSLPTLYWMLECRVCGSRRVVRDTFLEFVGADEAVPAPGGGCGGRPLPERYGCLKGCPIPPRVVASLDSADSEEMWLEDPYMPVKVDRTQREEWATLIRQAHLEAEE